MSGNVAEWCWDWFVGDYDEQICYTGQDPTGYDMSGEGKIIRGGAAYGDMDGQAYNLQTAWRGMANSWIDADPINLATIGFRIVRRP